MQRPVFALASLFVSVTVALPALAAPRYPDSIAGMEHTLGGRFAADAGYVMDTSSREAVRLFYKTVFASSEGIASGWVGSVASCQAGDTSAAFKAATARRINWFRAMAGVPADIAFDATFSQKAQQAALIMSANNNLNHSPPSSWTCYNATGAESAGRSNLDLSRNGPASIVAYMFDFGASNNVVGHRRWLMYPQTRFMGVGDIEASSATVRSTNALWVYDANFGTTRPKVRDEFVAWPPKGYVPYQAVYGRWSISFPNADFSAATVSMTENGNSIATKLEPVANGYGENTLAWLPGSYTDAMVWSKPAADAVYQVTVSNVKVGGVARSFSYAVTVFDPDTSNAAATTISGSSTPPVGKPSTYTFGSTAGATAYQWRQLGVSPYTLKDGAETGASNFTSKTTGSYSVVVSDVAATGTASFHLAHPTSADQTLTLNTAVVPSASTTFSFASRLGLSAPSQVASVEASADEGSSWTELWSQAGKQTGSTSSFGETSFTTRSVSLASLAGRSIKLRFRYTYRCCEGIYPQTSTGIGWYIDDINIGNAETLSSVGAAQALTSTSFSLTPTQSGDILLQVRPGMYDYFGDWSPVTRVSASAGTTTTLSDSERLMNWAEFRYPQLFNPKATTQSVAGYALRGYAGTTYLGTKDGRVYFYNPGLNLLDLGTLADFIKQASADGF